MILFYEKKGKVSDFQWQQIAIFPSLSKLTEKVHAFFVICTELGPLWKTSIDHMKNLYRVGWFSFGRFDYKGA